MEEVVQQLRERVEHARLVLVEETNAYLNLAENATPGQRGPVQRRMEAADAEVKRLVGVLNSLVGGTAPVGAASIKVPSGLQPWKDFSSGKRIDEFLEKFELVLAANGIPLARWRNLILPLLPLTEMRKIRDSTDNTTPWAAGRAAVRSLLFTDQDLLHAVRNLASATPHRGESMDKYASRYERLRVAAGAADDAQRAELFIMSLPSAMQTSLYQVRVSRGQNGNLLPLTNVSSAYTMVRQLDIPNQHHRSNHTPSRDDQASSASSSHSANKSSTKSTKKRYCRLHGHVGHDTSHCRVLNKSRDRNRPSAAPTRNNDRQRYQPHRQQQQQQSHQNHSAGQQRSGVICYNCNQPGHIAPQCPQRSTQNSRAARTRNSRAARTINDAQPIDPYAIPPGLEDEYFFPDEPQQPPSRAVMQASSSSSPASASASASSSSSTSATDTDDPKNPFLAPVEINGIRTTALIDCGCDFSAGRRAFLEECGVSAAFGPSGHSVALANGTYAQQGPRSLPFRLGFGSHTIETTLEMPDSLLHPVIIGRDLFPKLGLYMVGIPVTFPSDSTVSDAGDDALIDVSPRVEQPLSSQQQEQIMDNINDILEQNANVNGLCNHPLAVVRLPTNGNPVAVRQYPIPRVYKPSVARDVRHWIASHRVRLADPDTHWNLPLTAAAKKDAQGLKTGVRTCLDPRAINPMIPDVEFQLPRVSDLLEQIKGANVISTLDLADSYHQLPVAREDQQKLSFTFFGQKYCFVVAPFGLKFMTAHFQRLMSAILGKFYMFVIIFVDDVIVFSDNIPEHIEHLRIVIKTLTSWNLRLRMEKCRFGYSAAAILGHIVSGSEISPDPVKLSTFASMRIPVSGKQVASVLGFTNYLRAFIPLYSAVTAPLEALRKHKRITAEHWTAECEQAWNSLKKILSSPPVLSHPRSDLPFEVATDASQYGIGGMLYQTEEQDCRRYISFVSKSLTAAQRNYPAMRRELLAVLYSITQFRDWILGAKFHLFTDHSALRYLLTKPHTNRTLNYWAFTLMEYDFDVQHRPGIMNVLPDRLSRLYPPFLCNEGEDGRANLNSTPTSSTNQPVASRAAIATVEVSSHPSREMKEFIKHRLDKTEPASSERASLLDQYHSLAHEGAESLFKRLWNAGYWWSNMRSDCNKTVSQCHSCLQFSVVRSGFHPLRTIESHLPMDHVAIDLFGPLPTSASGYNFGLVFVDLFTRFVVVRPLSNKLALTVASELYQIACLLGLPRVIQSDNGTEFVNEVISSLKSLAGFDHHTISPYYPQSNGSAETNVKLVKRLLKRRCAGDYSQWETILPSIQLALNTRVTRRHGSTPFSLMFGRTANQFRDYRGLATSSDAKALPAIESLIAHHKIITDVVYPAIRQRTRAYNANLKKHFDESKRLVDFPDGSLVMLTTTDRTSNLDPTYSGPFKVLRRTSTGAYQLLDPTGKLHPTTVPPSRLKLVALAPTETKTTDSSNVYEVEKIIDHRGSGPTRQYLIKWKHYPSSQNTWEPASHIRSVACIKKYFSSLEGKSVEH